VTQPVHPPTPSARSRLIRSAPIVALGLIVVAFFWRMAFTNLILPRGDTFVYFYPYWAYRNAAMSAGRLPLWNPYLFMGAPFLANSQAGVLYPPNWALAWLDAPTAVKAAVIGHAVWAAVGMVAFTRRALHTDALPAVLSGIVFALGGYFTAQVEHVNQLQGLAWLPWLFWCWECATHGQPRSFLLVALVLGMQLLAGHTQTVFISGAALGLWMIWGVLGAWLDRVQPTEASDASPGWQTFFRPVGALAGAAVMGIGLAAAQVLPTFELARLSNRGGGLPFLEAVSFSAHPLILGRALLPGYAPQGLFTEYIAYPGVVALMLAALGLWIFRRRWPVLGLGALGGVGIFLATGAYNPVYWALVRVVPGFNLFRAPARWLALFAFAAAALAGSGLQALIDRAASRAERPITVIGPGVGIVVLAELAYLAPLSGDLIANATRPSIAEAAGWLIAAALGLLLIHRLTFGKANGHSITPALMTALVAAELFVAGRYLPYNDLSAPTVWANQRPSISTILAADADETPPGRMLSLSETRFDPGDIRELTAIYGPYLSGEAMYDFVIAVKDQEIIAPNLPLAWGIPSMDGFDGGVLPTRAYTQFTKLFLPPDTQSPDGRLREYLDQVPALDWLSLANVRWIITDKVADAWIEDVYYDLTYPQVLSASGQATAVARLNAPFNATAVGVVGEMADVSRIIQGEPIGTMTVYAEGADEPLVQPILAGEHVRAATGDAPARALFRWEGALPVERVEVAAAPGYEGTLVIRGVSVIDERTGAFLPATLSPNGEVRLAHSGDVKIYEYTETRPRAYLVCDPVFVEGAGEAIGVLDSDPERAVLAVETEADAPESTPCDKAGTTAITSYEAERVAINVDAGGDGRYLILSDAWYPGWTATVDGEPVEVLQANGYFRAAPVPAGQHTVVFTYNSRPLRTGAAVSTGCLLLLGAGLIVRWPVRLRPRSATP
jgi:hypothetical protein